jgi:DNA invertase Pin-like site-specific DNA recombinase
MTKFVAYYRVSTAKQGRSGLGLDAQRECIARYITSVGGKLCAEFTEVESGTHKDRPKLAAALAACRVHCATFIVAKLDRLARSVSFVSNFLESGCEFCAVDFPQANRFMLHLLAAVGEYEAKLISDRTRAALAATRRKGTKLGGDRGKQTQGQLRAANKASVAVRSAQAAQRAADLAPVIAELRSAGCVSLAQIATGLNAKGISTARGAEWSPTAVMRVMA